MSRIPYGAAGLRSFPLITVGASDYLTSIPTVAAGDFKIASEKQILTNTLAKILGFDSMSAIPSPGDIIEQNSDPTNIYATVIGVVLASGTVGTTGAGFIFVESVTGTWTDNGQINNRTTATSDIATVDAATTGVYTSAGNQIANTAALFGFANNQAYVAWTAAEATCRQMLIQSIGGTKWEDTEERFETEGHEAAYDPQGCVWTDAVGTATGQTTTNMRLSGAPVAPASAPKTGFYFEVTSGTGMGQAGYVKTYSSGASTNVAPYVALDVALDATSVVKFYRDAKRAPAHVVAGETGIALEANIKKVNDVTIVGDGSATPFQV